MNLSARKILICGDSFSADWSLKHQDYPGWPNLLADIHHVVNLSQAGCSEYKIWKQLCTVNLSLFDCVIVSHTSPFRIPIESHPDHHRDNLHKDCDLIYSDIKQSSNKSLQSAVDYFEKFFMPEYAIFVHDLIISHEIKYLESFKGTAIHITGLPQDFKFTDCNFISFENIFQEHHGLINHFSRKGNQMVFESINKAIT
jgi:hypothetical protein